MQICSRLLKQLALSPRSNFTFLRRFVKDDFLTTFLSMFLWRFVKEVLRKSFFAASVCSRIVQIFQFSLADFITAFQKTQFCVEDVLGKGPFWQRLKSYTVCTGALLLSRPWRLVLGPDRAKIPFPTRFVGNKIEQFLCWDFVREL